MRKDEGVREGDKREEGASGKRVEGGGREQEGGGREQKGAGREQEEKFKKEVELRAFFLFKYFMRIRRRRCRRKRLDIRREGRWKEEE